MTIADPRRANTLRVALIGAGMISEYHLFAWSRLARRAQIVAVADPDRAGYARGDWIRVLVK